jgi:hypothetical protein
MTIIFAEYGGIGIMQLSQKVFSQILVTYKQVIWHQQYVNVENTSFIGV